MKPTLITTRSPKRASVEIAAAHHRNPFRAAALAFGLGTVWLLALPGQAQNAFVQHNLVSDLAGQADNTDTNLVNPWGIAFSASGPFWISDNHAGVSTIYLSSGAPQSLVVSIPPPAGGTPPAAPSGIIYNATTDFLVGTNAAKFIFSTEDGTIVGWASGAAGVLEVDNSASGTVYKGLASGSSGGSNYLYATDFHNGKVAVFDHTCTAAALAGSFADPTIPAGFAPFGIQNIKGQLFVTYAKQDAAKHDDVGGPGNGYVNVFDTSGNLLKRLVSAGPLNSPWGVALAPAGFGPFGEALLIGNFGDGRINAFDPATGAWLGALNDSSGNPFAVIGLWGLAFGNGGKGGDAHTLYFTAGIAGPGSLEDHGLFASLTPVFPTFASPIDQGLSTALAWSGGIAPFLLQKKEGLLEPTWVDVLTTSNQSVTVAKDTPKGCYRLVSAVTNTVLPFTAWLDGPSEVPAVNTSATGVGALSLEGSNLSYRITFSGLSAPATASHIHSPAAATNSAGVSVPFTNVPGATSGTIAGTATLTADQVADLVNGMAYVNIHDAVYPGGEIRGQIVPLHVPMTLNGASEVPPVSTSATATVSLTLVGSQLSYVISYSGLAGPATASHIHGPGDTATAAPVLVPLNTPTGTAGTISGSVSLTPTQMAYLLAGLTYINIHSTTNPGGEIRGQIFPVQLSVALNGPSEVPPTTSLGTGAGTMTILNSLLAYNLSFTNLLSPAVAAHIHGPADAAHNASVIIPFTAPPASFGTIAGTAALSSDELMWLVTGQTYANVHTTNYPGGEIRGQILPHN